MPSPRHLNNNTGKLWFRLCPQLVVKTKYTDTLIKLLLTYLKCLTTFHSCTETCKLDSNVYISLCFYKMVFSFRLWVVWSILPCMFRINVGSLKVLVPFFSSNKRNMKKLYSGLKIAACKHILYKHRVLRSSIFFTIYRYYCYCSRSLQNMYKT